MPKQPKRWVYQPPRPARPPVPADLKVEVETRARELVETALKPKHICPPREDAQFNYLVDIWTKWYHSFFYFCGTYRCPGPDALSPSFETKFARLEYAGNRRFALAYMRYTGQWWELYRGLTLEECLTAISDEPHFIP